MGLVEDPSCELNDEFLVRFRTRNVIEPEAPIEILQEAHGLRSKHVEPGAPIVDEVIAVLPVNLLHNVLSPVMLRQMYKPIFTVARPCTSNEEGGKKPAPQPSTRASYRAA